MKLLQDPVERLLYISLAVVFLIILLSGIGIVVRLHDQNTLEQQIKEEAQITRAHTDCVALLLTQPNRGSLRIQDLQSCKIGP